MQIRPSITTLVIHHTQIPSLINASLKHFFASFTSGWWSLNGFLFTAVQKKI